MFSQKKGLILEFTDKTGFRCYGHALKDDQTPSLINAGKMLVRHVKSLEDPEPVMKNEEQRKSVITFKYKMIKGFID